MKVECIKIINPITGQPQRRSALLTIGRVYVVLSVFADPGRHIEFRIIGDNDQTPTLFNSDQFRIVSHHIPSTWVITGDNEGAIWLAPERWSRRGFWEDYFNDDVEAIQQFKEEVAVIMAEVG